MSVRVLIVDDSSVVRGIIRQVLSGLPDIEVVGEASDGRQAERQVLELKPDVVTMDVLMPMMGGLEALESIMAKSPTPVIIVAEARGNVQGLAMEALAHGALDVFPKPRGG